MLKNFSILLNTIQVYKSLDCKVLQSGLKEPVNHGHFTDPSFQMRILLHCLHSFLVAAGQFSDGYSSDVLLVLYMTVHVCDYSEKVKQICMSDISNENEKLTW